MHSNKTPIKNHHGAGELFLVATPIGNLSDITLRAIETLKAVDRVACEDTRTSGVLMAHYGINAPLTAYHTHNEAEATASLVAQLSAGARIALISDAGTPLLSDPGARLVAAAVAAGIRVTPIPGASALLSALTISGLPAEQFYYAGFLPSKKGAREAMLVSLQAIPATLVFYEAPHRLVATLTHLQTLYGERAAAVGRELTKRFEECQRGTLASLVSHFETHAPRGECVIVVAGAAPTAALDDTAIDAALAQALKTLRLKDAVVEVAKHAGRAKSEVYARALALKGGA